jgi:transposase
MRKQYSKEFKIKVCKEIVAGLTTVGKLAKEYSISRPIVSRWLAEYQRYQDQAFSGQGNRLPDQAKIYSLEKQVEELKMENEILKKFAAFVKRERKKGFNL